MSHILALDIGTSSVRASVYNRAGLVLPETLVKNSRVIEFTEDGGAEISADEAFRQITEAIDEALKRFDGEISHVAASCFWHSLVGIDAQGQATTPVFTWAETRPKQYVRILRDNLDEKKIHGRTGCRFHSSYWTAKLLWLKQERKTVFRKTAKWLSFSDYLVQRLANQTVTSVSMASGTGVFDSRKNDWDGELLDFLSLKKENLAEIGADDFTFQTDRWERLKDAKWFLAIGDGAANNLGAGCVSKEKAALMIGTSGAMRTAFAGDFPRKIPNGLWAYRVDRKRVIVGGALSDGGGLYRWLKDTLKIAENDDETEAEIEKREPDSHGLTFLPFLAGERSVGYHENAKGAILGLTQYASAVEITQAALEGVAYSFGEIFDQLRQTLEIKTVIASGGALRESPVWTQIIADVLGENLSLPDTREASSRGAVLLALEVLGEIKDVAKLPSPEGDKFNFDARRHKIYNEARKRREAFYNLLIK